MRKVKKFKIPKAIKVGGRRFKVIVVDTQSKKLIKELGEVGGWCDWCGGRIGLVKKNGADLSVLFHEIGHIAADCVKATNALRNETFARPFFAIFFTALQDAGIIEKV